MALDRAAGAEKEHEHSPRLPPEVTPADVFPLTSAVDVERDALVEAGPQEPLDARTAAVFSAEEKLVLRCVRLHHPFTFCGLIIIIIKKNPVQADYWTGSKVFTNKVKC